MTAYSETHTKPTHTLCEQNTELLNIKVCGPHSNYYALSG
jgi:hypothetical protein